MLRSLPSVAEILMESLPYPQSHLRNLARTSTRGQHPVSQVFTFMVDLDIVLSEGAWKGLMRFLEEGPHPEKTAFVVPVFELNAKVTKLASLFPTTNYCFVSMHPRQKRTWWQL